MKVSCSTRQWAFTRFLTLANGGMSKLACLCQWAGTQFGAIWRPMSYETFPSACERVSAIRSNIVRMPLNMRCNLQGTWIPSLRIASSRCGLTILRLITLIVGERLCAAYSPRVLLAGLFRILSMFNSLSEHVTVWPSPEPLSLRRDPGIINRLTARTRRRLFYYYEL